MINKKIKITDIFGNKLDNKLNRYPFIVLTTINDKSITELRLLNKVADNIWKYDMRNICKILSNHKIDAKQFNPAGYIYINNNNNNSIKSLLLINKNISRQPYDFLFVGNYKHGSLWKPLGYPPVNNNKILSLVYSPNKKKPIDYNIALINGDFLVKCNNNFNEFNLLNSNIISNKQKVYTINRNLFTQVYEAFNFKPIQNNKYKDYQKIYTVQGEFQDDKDDDQMLWDIDLDTIIGCKEDLPNNIKYKGENVILVQSDNPWYLDCVEDTEPEISNIKIINQENSSSNIEHYKTNNNDMNESVYEPSLIKNPLCWLIILILILIIIRRIIN